MGEGDAESPPLADVGAGSLVVAVAAAVEVGSMAGKAVVVVVGLLLMAAGTALEPTQ